MAILGYCANSVKDINENWPVEVAQITLNSRMHPSKRDYMALVKSAPRKVVLHYDFIYLITRYIIFSDKVKKSMLHEIAKILSTPNPDVLGLVMHTDYPIRNSIYLKGEGLELYNKPLYNFELLQTYVNDGNYVKLVEDSIDLFYRDLVGFCVNPVRKMFLENTTKVFRGDGDLTGSFGWIKALFDKHPEYKSHFGLCLDTEHYYAVCGEYPVVISEKNLCNEMGIDLMVHLNSIPKEVKDSVGRGVMYKDVHSETLLRECSIVKPDEYKNILQSLSDTVVIREIKQNFIISELKEVKQWNQE